MKALGDYTLNEMKQVCEKHLEGIKTLFTKELCEGCKLEQVCDEMDLFIPKDCEFKYEAKVDSDVVL